MPIITSLLDADFYKFTMAQVIRKQHPGVRVRFALTNRSRKTDLLAATVDIGRLREELQIARGLRLLNREIAYLRNCPGYPPHLFSEEYLGWLAGLRLPPIEVGIKNGEISVETEGDWEQVTFWETLVLNVVNELYYERLQERGAVHEDCLDPSLDSEGLSRLRHKLVRVRNLPSARIIEFGNRRHFSASWHERVLEEMIDLLPQKQLLGTSNVRLAKKFGLQPIGTFAHEMFMCYAAIAHSRGGNIAKTHGQVLTDWRDMYGDQLSVALTDTFGSGFFFRDMSEQAAEDWQWLRHDSGDPFVFGERAIGFYKAHFIDPATKGIVYSDGLTVDVIERLVKAFDGRIKVAFGWGTDLTNDLGYRPLSLVMKAVEARGYGTVKLSDNPAKAVGRPDKIGLYKDIFQYEEGERVECKY